jgi:putative acetyltransferase
MSVVIADQRPDSRDAVALIAELDAILTPLYPTESRHGYSVEKLLRQGVIFFIIHVDEAPAGCGGVQYFEQEYGELKRMYVRPQFRGRRLARMLLEHLANHARQRGVELLRLETGIHQREAIALYTSFGFSRIPPFGSYREDPNSLCFEMRLG